MSQSVKCPVELSLRDILKSKLPDDDVTQTTEMELLQKWGFPEEFMKVLDESKNQKQISSDNANSAYLENAILRTTSKPNEVKVTTSCTKENDDALKSCTDTQTPILNDRVREIHDKATVCCCSGQFEDSLVSINKALDSGEFPDDKMALLSLKARVLNAMGDYIGTLRFIEEVCGGHISGCLILEGAKALEKLNLLLTAEEWLKKILQTRSEDRDTFSLKLTVQELFLGVRLRRIYEPLIQNAPIKIALSKTGRAVFTKHWIAKGDVLFSELPDFVEQSLASQSVTVCSHCGSTLLKPDQVLAKEKPVPADVRKAVKKFCQSRATVPCQGCIRAIYCSESCRQDAWLRYHKDICPSSQNSPATVLYDVRDSFRDVTSVNDSSWQGWWNAEFSPLLLARVWATLLIQVKLLAGDFASLNSHDVLMAAFLKIKKYSINSEISVCTRVPRMFDLIRNIFKRSKFLGYEITEAEFDQMYHRISTNYISFHDASNPTHDCLNRTKPNQKLYKKIVKFLQQPAPKAELQGLFPLASCINHCCLPNAEILSRVVDGRPGIAITAKVDIPAMEEVKVAYVDPQLPRTERRDMLFRRYAFWCQCLRCQFEGDGPDTCTQCGKHPQTPTPNRLSEGNQDSFDCGQNCSDIQDTNVTQDFTESSQFLQLKSNSLFDNSNCRSEKQKDPREVNHLESLHTKVANKEQSYELRVAVTDVTRLDVHENCGFDNGLIHIPFQTDSPGDSSEQAPNGQTEEIRAYDENTTRLQNVSGTGDKMGLKSGLDSEREGSSKYPHCSRCGKAWYCSQKCQKDAWKRGHKQICGKY